MNRPAWFDTRFMPKVSVGPSGCWLWTGAVTGTGYGSYRPPGDAVLVAHRVAYVVLVGSIPSGLVIDHLCRVRSCVNPTHLDVVTRRINTLRGVGPSAVHAAQARCKRGHAYEPANLKITNAGSRRCIACDRLRDPGHRRKAVTA